MRLAVAAAAEIAEGKIGRFDAAAYVDYVGAMKKTQRAVMRKRTVMDGIDALVHAIGYTDAIRVTLLMWREMMDR